jgi:YVTN family beta-propeller protein
LISVNVLRSLPILALGASLLVTGVAPVAAQQQSAAATAPKAYIGLFKDNAVAVLDTGTNKVMKTIPIPTGPHGLVVTPDGRWVYASSDGDSVVSVIDTGTDNVTDTIQVGSMPHGLAMTPDGGRVLVAGFGTDSVRAIDTATHAVVWQVPVPQPHNIAISSDGQTAYVAAQKDGEQQLTILDVPSGAETGSVPLDHTPRALNFSPDGTDLAYTLAGVDALQILDLASGQLDTQVPTGASPHHPLFTPDGALGLVVSQGPGTLDFFDPSSYSPLGTVKVGDMPHWIAVTADSRQAYVTNENSNNVSLVNLSDRSVTATIPVGNAPRKIVIQPVGGATPAAGATTSAPAAANTTNPAPAPAPNPTNPGAANATNPAPAPAANATGPGAAAASAVNIASFAFSPKTLSVKAGQTVTFSNNDSVAHTVTSSTWDSGNIQPGAAFTLTAPKAGTYAYHCSIHPFMTGTLTVQ